MEIHICGSQRRDAKRLSWPLLVAELAELGNVDGRWLQDVARTFLLDHVRCGHLQHDRAKRWLFGETCCGNKALELLAAALYCVYQFGFVCWFVNGHENQKLQEIHFPPFERPRKYVPSRRALPHHRDRWKLRGTDQKASLHCRFRA